MKLRVRHGIAAVVVGTVALAAAGCSATASAPATPQFDPNAPVTITVGDLPSTQAEAARKTFLDSVDAFEKAHPNVTIETSETRWDNGSFSALVAGGTMPTVMSVPFTNTKQVIDNGQVADITNIAGPLGILDRVNPDTLKQAQDDAGNTYGIPTSVDALGLIYNRELFQQAGLDPDDPPSTWDEVREAAKTITEKTGVPGYLQMTEEGQGGWIYTATVYSQGGTVEDPTGGKVTLDSDQSVDALKTVHDMYWDDKSMGSTVLFSLKTLMQEYAANRAGMFIAPVQTYEWLNNVYDIDLSTIGATHVPQAEGGPYGALLSGNVQMFNPKSTPEQLNAAAEWVDYYYFGKYTDEETAVANAKAVVADGGVVGLPGLSPLSPEAYDQYRKWIADYINVDPAHFTGYTDSLAEIPLIPEPATRAQEVYADLAPTVQQALTDENADLKALISDASSRIDRIISQG
ncbi:extracellular solute-binding protein [Cnuibacter physcomitrellae]|uniref:ABC transporter substrate-binding protein n=1 Tax=Cnuibacter physcomitrellae TaxID=1619308 RepID=UPI002175D065|nr:extracellular solute-binding protein [Cnuibacter physcomitrellae]MCS5495865.1 extracellular solute-binding protein [Cnuibacter physcomitrellae]